MKNAKTHSLRSRFLKILAVTLSLVLIVGVLPASAATKTIEVKSKKQLIEALSKKSSATIVFKTKKAIKFIIPEIEQSANKKLVIEAPNATLFNKASLKTITLNGSKAFTEKGKDNAIYVKADGTKLNIGKGIDVSKVSVSATNVDISVAKKAAVDNIICKLKSAVVNLDVAAKADVNVTLSKKTVLNITGDKKADVDVVNKAKNSTIKTEVPVDVTAEKALKKLTLDEGAEGSELTLGDGVDEKDIKISGSAKEEITVKEDDGDIVKEPEKTPEKETVKEEEKKQDTTPETDTQTTTPSTDSGQIYVTTYKVFADLDTTNGAVTIKSGSVTVSSGSSISAGSSLTVTLAPNSGYEGHVSHSGGGSAVLTETSANVWTISNITADITVIAGFTVASTPGGGEAGNEPESGSATSAAITLKAASVTTQTASGGSITTYRFSLVYDSVAWATVTVDVATGTSISAATGSAITVTKSLPASGNVSDVTGLDMSETATVDYSNIVDKIKATFTGILPENVRRSNVH